MNGDSALLGRWLEIYHNIKVEPPFHAMGIVRGGKIIGAAIFNDFDQRNIALSCIGKGAFTKGVCEEIARRAFDLDKCNRITIRVRSDNAYVLKVAKKFGWVQEGIMRGYYDDCDCVVMGMLKSECRFYKEAKDG